MADIFEEIDEDLKQDRVYQWWKKNNKRIIPAVIIVVLAIGAFYWWQSGQKAKLSKAGSDLRAAVEQIENGETDAAKSVLDDLAATGGPAGMLAGFERAKVARSEGDSKTAIGILEEIAGDSSLDALYRDRAKFTALLQRVGSDDPKTLIPEFEALASPAGVYRFSAREMVGLMQSQSGDTEAAIATLNSLKEMEGIPRSMLSRITNTLSVLEKKN